MNARDITFSFIVIICTITTETHSLAKSKVDDDITKNNIKNDFAKLLDSLVRVNRNRMEALNKFFNLNNFQTTKNTMRKSGDKERPTLAVYIVDQNEDSGKRHQISPGHSRRPSKRDSDSDSSSEGEDLTMEKAELFDDFNLRMHKVKDDSSLESGHVVLSSENNNPLSFKNDTLLSDSESSEERTLATKKYTGRLSRGCLQSSRSLTYCKVACKAAYRYACAYYSCSRSLYQRLRKECRKQCSLRFEYY